MKRLYVHLILSVVTTVLIIIVDFGSLTVLFYTGRTHMVAILLLLHVIGLHVTMTSLITAQGRKTNSLHCIAFITTGIVFASLFTQSAMLCLLSEQ